MTHQVLILPQNRSVTANHGERLTEVLRRHGFLTDAPCGGLGQCGKCRVDIDGTPTLACRTVIERDMTVMLPLSSEIHILTDGLSIESADSVDGYLLALDIGTTTVAGFLLKGADGTEIAAASRLNPQTAFGADVVSRIQAGLKGELHRLTAAIRDCITQIIHEVCEKAAIAPSQITAVCPVGNPAMQQLFLGLSPKNLAKIPFSALLTQTEIRPAQDYLPCCENASLYIVPNIAGFIGSDTIAGVLATDMDQTEAFCLLVDIGTNGEMVLGNRRRLIACSTAAGPALEGANVQYGMRGQSGAIDHVWTEKNVLRYSVIGGGAPIGICGSGLIDAVAAALEQGAINSRGKILHESGIIALTSHIHLTQDDIRQVQTAKGAMAAGIELMISKLGITYDQIEQVYLAGAFGTYMNPHSACRIGLLPSELEHKIIAVGNAAGSGAKLLALSPAAQQRAQSIAEKTEHLELGTHRDFPRCFAKNMRF